MKAIREWLNELEEPYRSQALENVRKLNDLPDSVLNGMSESLEESLYDAFIWMDSIQGLDYWVDLKNSL